MATTPSYFEMLVKRLGSKTPEFFKVIIYYAGIIGAVGAAFVALPEFTSLPPFLQDLGGYMVAIGAAAASVAGLTTKDPVIQAKSEIAAKN